MTVAVVLTLLLSLLGCGPDEEPERAQPIGGGGRGISLEQARAQEQRILDQRAKAVRERDLGLFLRRVDRSDKGLLNRQRRYFANLVQLPLRRFRYEVTDAEWEGQRVARRWGPQVHIPQVRLTMQLQDFDAVPVERTVGFVFSFRKGRATLVSDRSAGGRPLYLGTPAPWDLTPVTVQEDSGVLGIFDRRTADSAATVLDVVREGIAQVDRALPFEWSGRVVVYSVEDPRVLASFRDVPGGVIEHLGAMTFPTYADDKRSQVASTRMLVMPSSIAAGQPFLGRITRHELSHVAIGARDDGAPTWVSEGIAEYLGARDLPMRQRIIATAALQRAASVEARMPTSGDFNNSDQEWHYALSWMACDYIAESFGESRLWELVDAMHNGGQGTSDTQQDRVLDQVLGFDSHELGLRAAARIRTIYG